MTTKADTFNVVRTDTLKVGDIVIDFFSTKAAADGFLELVEAGSRSIHPDPVTEGDLDDKLQWPYAVVPVVVPVEPRAKTKAFL